MQILASAFFVIPFALALLLSWHGALGPFRRSMLNPMLLVAAYVFLVAGDYASMAITGQGFLADRTIWNSGLGLLQMGHAAMLIATLAGMAVALQIFSPRPSPPVANQDMRTFTAVAYLVVLLLWFVALLPYASGGLSLEGSAKIRTESMWDGPLFIFSLALVPALCYMLPRQSFKVTIPVILVSLFVLVFSGSRTRILFVLIPFLFYLVRVRRINLPRSLFLAVTLFAGFLALLAVNYRVATSRGVHATFSELATTSNVFNAHDVAFAETDVELARLPRRAVEAYPGQSLVGFFLADIPRAIIPFKPFKGSDQFTQAYDPINWRLYKRGLTIGAMNELKYDYPFAVALLLTFAFGLAWMWGFLKAASSRTIHGFSWSIGLYICLYTYFKADIQSVGQILWAFGVYTLVVSAYQRIRGAATTRPRVRGVSRAPAAKPEPVPAI